MSKYEFLICHYAQNDWVQLLELLNKVWDLGLV